jgi:hypothetical protein
MTNLASRSTERDTTYFRAVLGSRRLLEVLVRTGIFRRCITAGLLDVNKKLSDPRTSTLMSAPCTGIYSRARVQVARTRSFRVVAGKELERTATFF